MSEPKKPTEITTPGFSPPTYYAPGRSPDQVPEEIVRQEEAEALRAQLGANVEAARALGDVPRPVTEQARENLRARTRNEIFGNKETQAWYIKTVREALEKMGNGDDLYEFIRKHPSYEAKKAHVQWNRDFAALFKLTIDKKYQGANEDVTNRMITAAAQHLLVEFYKNDVFQLTQKIANPWIFIDGRMGPYTVSVLSEYWMAKYGKESKKSPKPPGRAGVAGEYKPESPGAKTYDVAMHHLDVQTSTPPAPASPAVGETPAETDVDAKVRAGYAKLDKADKDFDNAELKIDEYECEEDMLLSEALAEAYDEEVKPKNTEDSPKLFRTLNLLAKKMGAKLDSEDMNVKEDDIINISPAGIFTVTRGETIIHEVSLWGPTPPAEPPKEGEEKHAPEESEEDMKKRLAALDQAGDKINNAKDLEIKHSLTKTFISLDLALGEAYEKKGYTIADKTACVNRVLNLLAQKLGAKVKNMPVEAGDFLEITADGNFSVTKSDGTVRYNPIKIF